MLGLIDNQPYLVMSLVLFLLCTIGLALFPSQRRPTILAGLISVPFCLYELIFVPEYWSPYQEGGRLIGSADVLFSFSTGGIAWMLAALSFRRRVTLVWDSRLFCRRFLGGSLAGVIFSLCLWFSGMKIMTGVLVSIAVGLIVLSWRCPGFSRVSILSAVSFAVLYFTVLKLTFLALSTFPQRWNLGNLSGLTIFGVPGEEILWALCFGAIWPHFSSYVFNVRGVGVEKRICPPIPLYRSQQVFSSVTIVGD